MVGVRGSHLPEAIRHRSRPGDPPRLGNGRAEVGMAGAAAQGADATGRHRPAVSRGGDLRRALLVLGVQQRCKLRHGLFPRCRLSTNQHHPLGANASWNTYSAPESNIPHAIGASLDAKLHPVALRSAREASFKVINHAFERIAAARGSFSRRSVPACGCQSACGWQGGGNPRPNEQP